MDTSVAYRLEALEKFMEAVAQMLGCLPSYCDSHPDKGNAHIIERLRQLTRQSSRLDNACPIYHIFATKEGFSECPYCDQKLSGD